MLFQELYHNIHYTGSPLFIPILLIYPLSLSLPMHVLHQPTNTCMWLYLIN